MERKQLQSTNLRSAGFDAETNTLEVEFNHGGIYQYQDVPHSKYLALLDAASHGTYFDKEIKKAGYAYNKIG